MTELRLLRRSALGSVVIYRVVGVDDGRTHPTCTTQGLPIVHITMHDRELLPRDFTLTPPRIARQVYKVCKV